MNKFVSRVAMMGVLCAAVLSFPGCEKSSEDVQNEKQEQLNKQAVNSVSMPDITKFSEKRMLKMILELRDQMPPTYTYVKDEVGGKLHLLCKSMGFGLDGATQFTSPQRREGGTSAVIPQADPNGLYSPATSEGSWIPCLNPNDNKSIAIIRVEPRMIVSPFRLKSSDDYVQYPEDNR